MVQIQSQSNGVKGRAFGSKNPGDPFIEQRLELFNVIVQDYNEVFKK